MKLRKKKQLKKKTKKQAKSTRVNLLNSDHKIGITL
jgi:hypothetical protein